MHDIATLFYEPEMLDVQYCGHIQLDISRAHLRYPLCDYFYRRAEASQYVPRLIVCYSSRFYMDTVCWGKALQIFLHYVRCIHVYENKDYVHKACN